VNGDRWVSTPAAGLLRQQGPVQGGLWTQWNSSINFPSNGLTCLAMDPSRRVWTGTQIFGLVRVDSDGAFTSYTTTNSGLPDNEVRSLMAAEDGSIWVGTIFGGVARYEAGVGIVEGNGSKAFQLYPNPATEMARVIPRLTMPFAWRLLDSTGRPVRHGQGPSGQIRVADLPSGAYFVEVRQGGLVDRKPLFVEH
jgi:hypothetical protein